MDGLVNFPRFFNTEGLNSIGVEPSNITGVYKTYIHGVFYKLCMIFISSALHMS